MRKVVYCAKSNSVLFEEDAWYLDGVPYRPEFAPSGAKPFGGLTVVLSVVDPPVEAPPEAPVEPLALTQERRSKRPE